jgi:hypothetical protein
MKVPQSDVESWSLFSLLEAQSQPLRPEILKWLRVVLSASGEFRWEWVLAFLDSRHTDAREMSLACAGSPSTPKSPLAPITSTLTFPRRVGASGH